MATGGVDGGAPNAPRTDGYAITLDDAEIARTADANLRAGEPIAHDGVEYIVKAIVTIGGVKSYTVGFPVKIKK